MKTFFKMLGFLTWAAGLVAGLVMDAILPVWCAAIIPGSVLFAIGKLLENQEAMLANQKQILAELKNTRSGGKKTVNPDGFGKKEGHEAEQDSAENTGSKSTADAGIAGGKACPVCGERQRPDRETCIACGSPLY